MINFNTSNQVTQEVNLKGMVITPDTLSKEKLEMFNNMTGWPVIYSINKTIMYHLSVEAVHVKMHFKTIYLKFILLLKKFHNYGIPLFCHYKAIFLCPSVSAISSQCLHNILTLISQIIRIESKFTALYVLLRFFFQEQNQSLRIKFNGLL